MKEEKIIYIMLLILTLNLSFCLFSVIKIREEQKTIKARLDCVETMLLNTNNKMNHVEKLYNKLIIHPNT